MSLFLAIITYTSCTSTSEVSGGGGRMDRDLTLAFLG